jgi:hypothetical protein
MDNTERRKWYVAPDEIEVYQEPDDGQLAGKIVANGAGSTPEERELHAQQIAYDHNRVIELEKEVEVWAATCERLKAYSERLGQALGVSTVTTYSHHTMTTIPGEETTGD